jgi:hypothetical protein
MTWAIVDPRFGRPLEADDHCRKLRWYIDRLKAALAADPVRRGQRNVINFDAEELRMPATVAEVRRRRRRQHGMDETAPEPVASRDGAA